MATKLSLEDPQLYTGHCFRRTSATMAADGGATPQQMQRAFGWRRISTAQRYIEETDSGAQSMASIISKTISVSTKSCETQDSALNACTKTYNIQAAGENNTYCFY